MLRWSLLYWVRFYFYAISFFVHDAFYFKHRNKTPAVLSEGPAVINLLDDGEAVVMQKPDPAAAMANKAKLALSAISKDIKTKLILGIIIVVFFMGWGVVSSFYCLITTIVKYPLIGWFLLGGVLSYFVYRILHSIYMYFKLKKHHAVLSIIKELWQEAKLKSDKKLNQIS